MPRPWWTIYYEDGSTVSGRTAEEWRRAPAGGVQVVVLWKVPRPDQRPWRLVDDRFIWTGTDTYDPWGWGPKDGTLLSDEAYFRIVDRAFYGPPPQGVTIAGR